MVGGHGYVAKGAGTRKPREYETTIDCVLNIKSLFRAGYDLFLTANGVVLIYDDVSLGYFRIVYRHPYLGLGVFSHSIPHTLPREVQNWKLERQFEFEEEVRGILVTRRDIQVH